FGLSGRRTDVGAAGGIRPAFDPGEAHAQFLRGQGVETVAVAGGSVNGARISPSQRPGVAIDGPSRDFRGETDAADDFARQEGGKKCAARKQFHGLFGRPVLTGSGTLGY